MVLWRLVPISALLLSRGQSSRNLLVRMWLQSSFILGLLTSAAVVIEDMLGCIRFKHVALHANRKFQPLRNVNHFAYLLNEPG